MDKNWTRRLLELLADPLGIGPRELIVLSIAFAVIGSMTFVGYAVFCEAEIIAEHGSPIAWHVKIADLLQIATTLLGCLSLACTLGAYVRRGGKTVWPLGLFCLFFGIAVLLFSFLQF